MKSFWFCKFWIASLSAVIAIASGSSMSSHPAGISGILSGIGFVSSNVPASIAIAKASWKAWLNAVWSKLGRIKSKSWKAYSSASLTNACMPVYWSIKSAIMELKACY